MTTTAESLLQLGAALPRYLLAFSAVAQKHPKLVHDFACAMAEALGEPPPAPRGPWKVELSPVERDAVLSVLARMETLAEKTLKMVFFSPAQRASAFAEALTQIQMLAGGFRKELEDRRA